MTPSSVHGRVTLATALGASLALGCSPAQPDESTEVIEQALAGDFLQPAGATTVVMEAEHFTGNVTQGGRSWSPDATNTPSGGQALKALPDMGANVNTGYTTGSPRLDFRVNFRVTGTYQVWLRGRAGGTVAGDSDSAHAGLDGAAIASADRINGFTATFSWRKTTMDSVSATFNVPSTGIHTVNVWMREDGFVVDKIVLTTDPNFTPSGTGPAETPREPPAIETCMDGIKNGAETAIDCGGGTCPTCPNGAACLVNGDCTSGSCVGNTCQASTTPIYLDPSQPVPARVADLLSRMTLDEKIGQMTQSEQQTSSPDSVRTLFIGSVLSGADSTLNPPSAAAWADLADGYQNGALATRLRIPIIYGIDAVHGHAKVQNGTVFPHNIGLGATRNPGLVQQVGAITAQEMRACGIPWTFAPALTVTRDQRWGRAYESFSEDPALVAQMTTAISGLQGTSLNLPTSALATAKHFVADGGAMWGTGSNPGGTPIDRGNAQMTDAALRAIHLAPYTNAIQRGVGSIMASFSSYNGTRMHANDTLINAVLKTELGFTGFVVSDWQAIDQLTGTFEEKVRTSVNAGVDMFMMPDSYASFINAVRTEVNAGRITQARIDDAVRRIVTKKFELGMFETPMANRSGAAQIGSAANRAVARQAVRESLVLLKNEGSFLPLSPTTTVCVTGNGASNIRAQVGGWTLGWQQPLSTLSGATTILQGITQVVGASNVVASGCQVGIRVVSETLQSYAEWFGDDSDPDHDASGTCTAPGGCVVVLLGGRPMDIQSLLADSTTRAIVMAWYPGSEGLGVAEVLYGVGGANFVGKLPVTWKVDATETPVNFCAAALPNTCGDTGDHYSNTATPPATVLFPYGFGMSYGAGPSCTNGIRDGSETDIDCGGSCAANCANGQMCSVAGDCQSNNCVSGLCQANTAPVVSVTAPLNNATVVAGSTITISANASDSDGTISKVEFFVGSTEILPEDMSSPYGVSWTVPTGPASYSLTARATDNLGAVTTSTAVGISATATCSDTVRNGSETDVDCGGSCVANCANGQMCSVAGDCQSNNCVAGLCQAVGNIAPVVNVTAPLNGATVVAGSTVTISANASDSDGTVSRVQFFVGTTQVGLDDTSAPYGVSWTVPIGPASYSLTARATDNVGAVTTSAAIGVTSTATCSDGVQNGTETGIDCGGSCTACATSSPCSGLCSNPILYAGPNFNSGNLGTGATCHQTVANLSGGNCGNFSGTRTFRVNGTNVPCTGGNWASLPAKRNGGYCFQATAGDFAWAYFTTW